MPMPREPIHRRVAKAIAHPFNSLILGPDWEEKLKSHSKRTHSERKKKNVPL